jgi:hypothetical protein
VRERGGEREREKRVQEEKEGRERKVREKRNQDIEFNFYFNKPFFAFFFATLAEGSG